MEIYSETVTSLYRGLMYNSHVSPLLHILGLLLEILCHKRRFIELVSVEKKMFSMSLEIGKVNKDLITCTLQQDSAAFVRNFNLLKY